MIYRELTKKEYKKNLKDVLGLREHTQGRKQMAKWEILSKARIQSPVDRVWL